MKRRLKNGIATMEPLSKSWLILASFPRSWLAFARWKDLGKVSKELSTDLAKDTIASNIG